MNLPFGTNVRCDAGNARPDSELKVNTILGSTILEVRGNLMDIENCGRRGVVYACGMACTSEKHARLLIHLQRVPFFIETGCLTSYMPTC